VGAIVRVDDRLGWKATLVDQLFAQLLTDFSPERRQALVTFLAQVSSDQSLVTQLALEAMDVFNAGTANRPGVRYGSVVTRARYPSWKGRLHAGMSPYAQGTYALYSFLHRKACAFPEARKPTLSLEQLDRMRDSNGALPALRSSDGIVPTWSQPWGEVIASVRADHLDVIGHFDDPGYQPPHVDWLLSNSEFRRPQFETVWRQVVDFCLRPPLVMGRHDVF
ncbi:MAG: triacylglycerol lipase, partial [Myxococcaceae bacterium]|nr:triacylglycerol lipase [Myxococcaceae bacterium]